MSNNPAEGIGWEHETQVRRVCNQASIMASLVWSKMNEVRDQVRGLQRGIRHEHKKLRAHYPVRTIRA